MVAADPCAGARRSAVHPEPPGRWRRTGRPGIIGPPAARGGTPDEACHGIMDATPHLRIVELSRDETEALLRAHHVGRIAFSWRDRVDVEPIHYVYDDGAIYARTSPGTKLLTLRHNPWVAFEVDEVHGLYDWRSAVVHGTVYAITPDGTRSERERYARALALLRTLEPAALTDRDPVPWRNVLFRISVGDMSGRMARSDGAG